MKRFFIILAISFITISSYSQKKDDPITFDNAFLISPSYTFQLPLNDMFHTYGFNSNLGIEFGYKFGANWLISAEGNFLFGARVKDTSLLDNLLTSSGFIVGKDGVLEEVHTTGRGINIMAKFGKTIYFNPKSPNSGLLLKFGIGYLQHKIFIDVKDKNVPQLSKEIRTGYDRFSNGIAFSQYIGLIRLEKNKYLNLSFGVEATEGITKNRRPYDFATGKTFDKTRFDLLIGFKFNWYLPVFMGKSSKNEYYYY